MMDEVLRSVFSRIVSRGALTIVTARGTPLTFGDGTGDEVRVRFADTRAELGVVLDPHLYLGELFMDGRFVVEQGTIYDFLEMAMRETTGRARTLPARILERVRYLTRSLVSWNNPLRSRRNVAHHYDLDHRLYRLFLDRDFQYSCAYFDDPDCTLEQAQIAKKRLVSAKLFVERGNRILDIGSGWGGLGLYLKEIVGAKEVLGVTLSTEQLNAARGRARQRAVDDSVKFELKDYRSLTGEFDRIVSVGMFEHVGPRYYATFFNKCRELLRPDGVMVLHTIGHLDGPWHPSPWIDKYIFPGGHLPALSDMVPAIERAGLLVTDVECLRLHYASTLAEWRRRFMERRADALALYDERFCRMWEFYLAACESSFRYSQLGVYQVQCCRRVDALPITRDYIGERYAELRQTELQLAQSRAEAEAVEIPRRRHG